MIEDDLSESIGKRLRNTALALNVSKGVFVVLFSSVAGMAQFSDFPASGPTGSQITGIVATALVFIGGLFACVADVNAPKELESARRALEAAKEREFEAREVLNEFESFNAEMRRAVNLYLSVNAMRGVIERIDTGGELTDEKISELLLNAVHQYMPTAMSFEPWHRWTFGIYKAIPTHDGSSTELVCVAKRRAIECDLKDARRWPAGKGVMGVAFTNSEEVIIDDASIPSVRTVFAPAESAKPDDRDRYRSFAVVPVLVGHNDAPWGVVIATNDQVNHFVSDDEPGVRSFELVRAVASMMALGARLCNRLGGAENEHEHERA